MLSNRSQGHTVLFFELRLARVYLLDYITSTEIFQIGDRKKKKKKKKKKTWTYLSKILRSLPKLSDILK